MTKSINEAVAVKLGVQWCQIPNCPGADMDGDCEYKLRDYCAEWGLEACLEFLASQGRVSD